MLWKHWGSEVLLCFLLDVLSKYGILKQQTNKKMKLIDTENRLVVGCQGLGVGNIGKECQKVHTSVIK